MHTSPRRRWAHALVAVQLEQQMHADVLRSRAFPHLIDAHSLHARRALAVVLLQVAVRSGETRWTLARVVPNTIVADAVVQTWIGLALVGHSLTIQADVVVQADATVCVHQWHAQTIVHTRIARAVVDHRRTG